MSEPLMEAPDGTARVPAPAERAPMTAWFDPAQLVRTGVRVAVSELFGQNADRRVLDAVARHDASPCDESRHPELWLDYVADTGDGWNSTYAVAYHLARRTLRVADPAGATHDTERGRVLVFGGDQVYPSASRDAYEQRLVAPYRTALAATAEPHPSVFAVAGNHDWYDSLVAFTRLFCGTRDRWFGGWRARQALSYFAIKLPHGWWLLGTDVQLASDIDDPQLEYFRGIAAQMADGDRVILCTAEPHWIDEARYARFDAAVSQRNLHYLEREVLGRRIAVYLAGDLHHYRRHASPDGRQKITAGGGGAYCAPTHHDVDEVRELADGFTYRAAFPSPAESRAESWRIVGFPWFNRKFGFVTALLYLMLGWSVQAEVGGYGLRQIGPVLAALRDAVLGSHSAVLWGVVVITGFVFFTDTRSPRQKKIGGTLHALAHLTAAFLVGWGGSYLAQHTLGAASGSWQALLVTGACLLVGGYLVGAEIVALYLLVSLNVFGRHNNEAFSAMHIEDYKSWLRLHVADDGTLRIYPIKLRRVPRKWRDVPGGAPDGSGDVAGLVVPDDRRATEPALVEAPIVVGG